MNIFDMADENSDSLRTRYNSLRSRYETQGNLGILDEFAKLVRDEWTVSILNSPMILRNMNWKSLERR